MQYQLTITVQLESACSPDRVAKQFTSLFEFGTIRDSIAEGLKLLQDPCLIDVSVQGKTRRVQP